MLGEIHTYSELRVQVREALRRQHPEWVDAVGNSRLCDSYDARFAKLLAAFAARELAAASEQAMKIIKNPESYFMDEGNVCVTAALRPGLTGGVAADCISTALQALS